MTSAIVGISTFLAIVYWRKHNGFWVCAIPITSIQQLFLRCQRLIESEKCVKSFDTGTWTWITWGNKKLFLAFRDCQPTRWTFLDLAIIGFVLCK
jgi:hypothetical protein